MATPIQSFDVTQDELEHWESKLREAMGNDGFAQSRRLNEQMAEKLATAMWHRADVANAIDACWESGSLTVYRSGRRWRPDFACNRAKLCAFHARLEGHRRIRRYLGPVLASWGRRRFQFVTMTIRNVPAGELQGAIDNLWRAWGKLRRQAVWKPVTAAMVNLETTWNAEKETHHPHLHALVALRRGADYDWRALQEHWLALSGSPGIDFEPVAIDSEAALMGVLKEIVKYPAKLKDAAGEGGGLLDMPDTAFQEWYVAFTGRRTLRTYGEWYRLAKPERDPDPAAAGESPILEMRWKWHRTGRLDVILIHVDNSTSIPEIEQALRGPESETTPHGPGKSGKDWKKCRGKPRIAPRKRG